MLLNRRIIFVVIVVVTIISLRPSYGSSAERDLQHDLETVLTQERLTGVAWMLIGESGEVNLGAAGLRDKPSKLNFTSDTRFHIGSVTKSLLATGILRLATQGQIELDAPVTRYLPNLSFDNPRNGDIDVTVQHLLDHTSGLNDAHLWHMFSERATPNVPLIAAFPDPDLQLRIRSRPGTRLSYSNMGYTLLGMIVEAVVNDNYESYLDEHLLAPLAMSNSTFEFTTQSGETADPLLAWGHVDDGSRYAAYPIFLRPAGQFTTTTADLALFAQFLLSDGLINGEPFIDQALMRSRGRPVGTEAANAGLDAGYALGLGRRDRHGVIGYCHGGNIVGFVAMLCIFPDENKAFAYSVNTDSETANYGRIDKLLIDAIGVDQASPPPTAEPAADIAKWHGRYILSPNRFQTFDYLDRVFGAIEISADNSYLTISSLQQATRQLRPVGDRLFSANDRTTNSHVFLIGDEGQYLVSDGFSTFEMTSDAYLFAHWTSITLAMCGLIWFFLSGVVSAARYRACMFRLPVAPAFVTTLLLLVPIPFFFVQSFMALGDVTPASLLLATVTFLLPVGMCLTIIRVKAAWDKSRVNLFHGLAAAFVLQWCAVLVAARLLPLMLWI
ncbi:MAG: serine hydrolase domain-containing protein [Halioglobus sp.]